MSQTHCNPQNRAASQLSFHPYPGPTAACCAAATAAATPNPDLSALLIVFSLSNKKTKPPTPQAGPLPGLASLIKMLLGSLAAATGCQCSSLGVWVQPGCQCSSLGVFPPVPSGCCGASLFALCLPLLTCCAGTPPCPVVLRCAFASLTREAARSRCTPGEARTKHGHSPQAPTPHRRPGSPTPPNKSEVLHSEERGGVE